MYELVFDIETNAIEDWANLSDLKVIHCIAVGDMSTGEVDLYHGDDIIKGLQKMRLADRLIGHNIKRFDIPAIKKLYPAYTLGDSHVIDTMIAGRIFNPDVARGDFTNRDMPPELRGRYSLKAWGYRLGLHKGDYGETTDWSEYTDEMGEYCKQDVLVNMKLWSAISETFNEDAHELEDRFDNIIRRQEKEGVTFDEDAAKRLHAELIGEKAEMEATLQEVFPPQEEPMKTPQYYYHKVTKKQYKRKKDYTNKDTFNLIAGPRKVRKIPFNPGSRLQIANALKAMYGWKPTELTGDGRPRVDEAVLSSLDYPEAKVLTRYLTIIKRLGQLSDGKEAWLKVVRDGKVHGRVNTIGTVSSRCSHSRPNLGQVPSLGSLWGKECRALFTPADGKVMVGCDMSGLELRCLAHYLARWDDGEYASVIQEGDIHQFNADKMGVSRSTGKGIMYATLYGAGDVKIGSLVGGGKTEGRRMRNMLERGIPALKRLKNAIAKKLQSQEWLPAIDGRRLPIRSEHSALNLLLQSAGSILMKRATVIMHEDFHNDRLDVQQLMHVHDEVQLQTNQEEADDVGRTAVQAMRKAGEHYEFRCPLDGEYKIGSTWADTH